MQPELFTTTYLCVPISVSHLFGMIILEVMHKIG